MKNLDFFLRGHLAKFKLLLNKVKEYPVSRIMETAWNCSAVPVKKHIILSPFTSISKKLFMVVQRLMKNIHPLLYVEKLDFWSFNFQYF